MGFSKIRYNTGNLIFRVEVKDETGALMEKWTFMEQDFQSWRKKMENKYGLNGKRSNDLDWAI